MKLASDIIKWGVVKPFFDKSYRFNSIDIETVDNELFILGFIKNGTYCHVEDNFYNVFNDLLLDSVRNKRDILTWTRYDNTHLLKLLLMNVAKNEINHLLLRIGKVTPIYSYQYKNYTYTIVNIIKDSMIIKIDDKNNKPRTVTIYNLKNLYQSGLEEVANNYKLSYYSKMGEEYHIIDKERFKNETTYHDNVLISNCLDCRVIIDIAYTMLENFKNVTGVYPKSIFTAGSIARSYLLSYKKLEVSDLNFKYLFKKNPLFNDLLDYSMRSYHGGKIESYVLGYIKKAKIIDISSAYPYAFSKLPKLTNCVWKYEGVEYLDLFYYAFIRCDIYIKNVDFIHPIIVSNPVSNTNISAVGWLENVVITKIEYDYLLANECEVHVYDYVGVEHIEGVFPYKDLIDELFTSRMREIGKNNALADLFKTIINSLYGITYELTDVYKEEGLAIEWLGYRAGDYFNPIIASYITSTIRTYLSEVSYDIVKNGGECYLNMTDSIIYNGTVSLDVFSQEKELGKFEMPTEIKDLIILGAGRYEYYDEFKKKYKIKNRGFSVNVKDKSFYSGLDLKGTVKLEHRTFVTSFKATTNKFNFDKMGHLIDDDYMINPFNLGGKRVIMDMKVNLNKEFTRTKALVMEKGVLK